MSRLGTCRFAHQVALEHQPADAATHVRQSAGDWQETYTCQWLDFIEECAEADIPPAIERQNGFFVIQEGDCERCPHFQPAADDQLAESMERYKLLRSQKKLAKKPRRRPAKPARAVK
jgi:hypothetical protein